MPALQWQLQPRSGPQGSWAGPHRLVAAGNTAAGRGAVLGSTKPLHSCCPRLCRMILVDPATLEAAKKLLCCRSPRAQGKAAEQDFHGLVPAGDPVLGHKWASSPEAGEGGFADVGVESLATLEALCNAVSFRPSNCRAMAPDDVSVTLKAQPDGWVQVCKLEFCFPGLQPWQLRRTTRAKA